MSEKVASAGEEDTGPNLEVTRRRFLLGMGWATFAAMIQGTLSAMGRFLFPNVLYEKPMRFRAGRPSDYPAGTRTYPSVSERFKDSQKVWIFRNDRGMYGLVAQCTHLGCTPNWSEAENRVRCPCHGSNFTVEGDVIAGPAPRPLWRPAIHLDDNGEIVIDKAELEDRPGPRDGGDFFLPIPPSA